MKRAELDQMSIDDLWLLHVEVSQLLQQRIKQKKLQLEERLTRLETPVSGHRPYPPVSPKYRNPDQPSETWTGRGKQPRWLVAHEIGKADRGFQYPGSEKEANQRCGLR